MIELINNTTGDSARAAITLKEFRPCVEVRKVDQSAKTP
jgi:hypothetical protein